MNCSQSDGPAPADSDEIESDQQYPIRPSEPCASGHASSSPSAVPRRSWGAIAAALFTILGALALSFGFAAVISEAISIAPEEVTVEVTWFENEGSNSEDKNPKPFVKKVPPGRRGYHDGYLVVPVTRSDLRFELIEQNAGWPPDLGKGDLFGEGGLVSYSIVITSGGQSRDATYIVQGPSRNEFLLLVPQDLTVPQIQSFDGRKLFRAGPEGVIELAKSEQEKAD